MSWISPVASFPLTIDSNPNSWPWSLRHRVIEPHVCPHPPSHSLCSSHRASQVPKYAKLLCHRAFAQANLFTQNALSQLAPSLSFKPQYKPPPMKVTLHPATHPPFSYSYKHRTLRQQGVIMYLSVCLFVYYLERTYVVSSFHPPFFGEISGCPCTWFWPGCQSPARPSPLSRIHTGPRNGGLIQAWATEHPTPLKQGLVPGKYRGPKLRQSVSTEQRAHGGFFFSTFIYFWERERQSMNGGGAEREGDTESETGSRL